jgi:hypothetical protein
MTRTQVHDVLGKSPSPGVRLAARGTERFNVLPNSPGPRFGCRSRRAELIPDCDEYDLRPKKF